MVDDMVDDRPARDYLFSQVFNFRDVGGMIGHSGRRVRHRRLYRSDSLHGLRPADREAFTALGVRTVIDLRRPYEVARDGRVPDWNGLAWRHIYLVHQEWIPFADSGEPDLPRYLAARYLSMAEESAAGLAGALDLIADQQSAPAVVHCVAGKDRTGMVCALALSLLGVSDEDIAADYALSTAGMDRYLTWLRVAHPAEVDKLPPLRAPATAMRLFLDGLRARYGSIPRYLAGIGLAPERAAQLRDHLLD